MLVLLLFILLPGCLAYEKDITFNVPAGRSECFYHQVLPDQIIDIEYQVIDASANGETDISFQLADPVGLILVADYKKPENAHKHTASIQGDYRFCFDNTFSTFSEKTVFFDLMIDTGEKEDDYVDDDREMSLGDPAATYMMRVRDISESVNRIKANIGSTRRLQELHSAHEARDRNLAEEMCSRVYYTSLVNVGIIFFAGLAQVFFVRLLFENPKKIVIDLKQKLINFRS